MKSAFHRTRAATLTLARHRSGRGAFTLVELLVTITIIGVLASLFLAAMASTTETGRIAATRATIAKIHNLIMQRYEMYRTRRVPIAFVNNAGNQNWPVVAAGQRLDCLRELMRLEMPDRWQDVISPPQTSPPGGWTPIARPSLSAAFLRRYNALQAINANSPSASYEGAECLYLVCTTGVSDEMDTLEQFRPNEIGDYDQDGAPEFWDAWGMPISFLRWAPGFISELQTGKDPDPFDPRHVYPSVSGSPGAVGIYTPVSTQTIPTFALYPLIYSGGPDKLAGIASKPPQPSGGPAVEFFYANYNNDPFATLNPANGATPSFGTVADVDSTPPSNSTSYNAADDIHNHMIGTR